MDAVLIDFDDTIVEVSDEARALRTKAIANHGHWADWNAPRLTDT